MKRGSCEGKVDAFKACKTPMPHEWIEDFILDLKLKL